MPAAVLYLLWVLLGLRQPTIDTAPPTAASYWLLNIGTNGREYLVYSDPVYWTIVWRTAWRGYLNRNDASPNARCYSQFYATRQPSRLSRFSLSHLNDLGCDNRLEGEI